MKHLNHLADEDIMNAVKNDRIEMLAVLFERHHVRLYNFLLRLTGNKTLQSYYENYFDTVEMALDEWDKAGLDRLFHSAPAAIVVAADKTSSCPGEDALLASQNMLLMGEALGLGSCLIGYVVEAARRDASINRLLDLDKKFQIYSVIALGHPAVKFLRPAGRRPLKPNMVHTV